MAKGIRILIGAVALLVCAYVLLRVYKSRQFAQELENAHAVYEAADSPEALQKAKATYEALRPKSRTKEQKRFVEAGIASCEANIAFYDATGRGSIKKYQRLVNLMEKARDLAGDPTGIWAKRLTTFRRRLEEAMGPSLEEMGRQWARLSKMPFQQASVELEALYRWRRIWHDQDMYLNDAAREAIFTSVRKHLIEQYTRALDESIRAARRPGASLEVQCAPLGPIGSIRVLDEARAYILAKKYEAELEAARKAANTLEERMERMEEEQLRP